MSHTLVTIYVKGNEVILDPSKLRFSEATLSIYLETEGGWYDYYASQLAEAEHELQKLEIKLDTVYADKFTYWKEEENCGSDKLAEQKTKKEHDVVDCRNAVADAKRNVRLLQQHLRAWDKSHENAQSRGHFLRKEMDKLNRDIMNASEDDEYRRISNIVHSHNLESE